MSEHDARSPDRVADAVAALAVTVEDAHVRTQLHALVGVVRNLGCASGSDAPRTVHDLAVAMDAGDEPAVIAAVRALARARRARVVETDWARASR